MRLHSYAPLLALVIALAGVGAWLQPPDGVEVPRNAAAQPTATTASLTWSASDAQVSDPDALFPGDVKSLYEPSIAIDPTDPDNVLVFALDFSVQNHDPNQYSVARGYRSTDGGATWADLGVVDYDPSSDDVHDGGDPVVVFDAAGTAYLATLGYFPAGAGTSVYLHRSTDGGATWELASIPVPGVADTEANSCANPDKEWLSVDPNTGDLLLTYTLFTERCEGLVPVFGFDTLVPTDIGVFFTRSADGGTTWSPPQRLWTGWALGSIPKVAPDGTIHVSFWSSVLLPKSPCPTALGVVAAREAFNAVVVASSADDGATWSYHTQGVCSTIEIADAIHPGRVIGGNIGPSLAIDPVSGDAFVVYPEIVLAELRHTIQIIRSTDAGATWSAPDDVTPGAHSGLLPTIIADAGTLRMAYVEGRSDGTADTYYIESGDGGNTWAVPFRLSTAASDLGLYPDIGPYRDPHTGDYISIDLAAGRIAVAWSDARQADEVQIFARTGVVF